MAQELCYSLSEWCDARKISRSTFYNLEKEGCAPDTYSVGRRRFISILADLRWQVEREEEKAFKFAKKKC